MWKGFNSREAGSGVGSQDPVLAGRTYAIPFATVWKAALGLAQGGLGGWRVGHSDDLAGVVEADVRGPILPVTTSVTISITLDENAQTRVDMSARGRLRGGDLGAHRRRVKRFVSALDRSLDARPGQILDAEPRGAYAA